MTEPVPYLNECKIGLIIKRTSSSMLYMHHRNHLRVAYVMDPQLSERKTHVTSERKNTEYQFNILNTLQLAKRKKTTSQQTKHQCLTRRYIGKLFWKHV